MKITQDFLDDLENLQEDLTDGGEFADLSQSPRKPKNKKRDQILGTLIEAKDQEDGGFRPTYTGSIHEHEWITKYLSGFYEDRLITDVVRQVKGGKEAQVYCCTAGPILETDLVAAKVYRPKQFRNIRNDSLYRQGRDVFDGSGHGSWGRRQMTAMKKRTDFGQELLHMSWLGNEFETMRMLYDLGADVPKPFAYAENAILMEYFGDLGMPAPILNSVTLEYDEAKTLFERVMRNVELMLQHSRVHGDLSAHNILYMDGEIRIIDFPQTVDPIINLESKFIFERDVTRVCQYFERFGVRSNAKELARELWVAYQP